MIFGIFFLAIGVFLLLGALGVITGITWTYFWAFFFIAIGFKILFGSKGCCSGFMHHRHMGDHCCDHDKKDRNVADGEYKEK